jgi:hypothetical protein
MEIERHNWVCQNTVGRTMDVLGVEVICMRPIAHTVRMEKMTTKRREKKEAWTFILDVVSICMRRMQNIGRIIIINSVRMSKVVAAIHRGNYERWLVLVEAICWLKTYRMRARGISAVGCDSYGTCHPKHDRSYPDIQQRVVEQPLYE